MGAVWAGLQAAPAARPRPPPPTKHSPAHQALPQIVLWALAKLGHRAGQGPATPQLLAALLERFVQHDEQDAPASVRHISAVIWACANLKCAWLAWCRAALV